MVSYELAKLIISATSLIFIGATLIYTGRQIKLLIKSHADNHEWNRRIATQQALNELRKVNVDDLNEKFGYINRHQPIPLAEVLAAFEENIALQMKCHQLLNYYEGTATAIFLGIYDELTVKISRKGAMERTFTNFKEYIEYRRNQTNNTVWIEYEKLINKWHSELRNRGEREPTGTL